jgi:rSAM/selenodomain-associated transferase 1
MAEGRLSGRYAPNLVIMAKAPVMGNVKRRLARDIGFVEAARFYRNALKQTVMRLGRSRRWRTYVAVSPDGAGARLFEPWRGPVIRQGRGDLGARMARAFLRLPPGPSVIVGSDIPALTERGVVAAFAALRGRDAVFGPAEDGGYWLAGLSRRTLARRMFLGVRWSSEHALSDTILNLTGRRVALTAELGDVDDGKSYARLAFLAARLTIPAVKPASRRPLT